MLGIVLGATDDAWLVPHRQAHGLSFIEFRVLEGGEPNQTICQRLGQISLGDENLVGQHQGQGFRQGASYSGRYR